MLNRFRESQKHSETSPTYTTNKLQLARHVEVFRCRSRFFVGVAGTSHRSQLYCWYENIRYLILNHSDFFGASQRCVTDAQKHAPMSASESGPSPSWTLSRKPASWQETLNFAPPVRVVRRLLSTGTATRRPCVSPANKSSSSNHGGLARPPRDRPYLRQRS